MVAKRLVVVWYCVCKSEARLCVWLCVCVGAWLLASGCLLSCGVFAARSEGMRIKQRCGACMLIINFSRLTSNIFIPLGVTI